MSDYILDTILLKEAYNDIRKIYNCTGLGQLQMPKHANVHDHPKMIQQLLTFWYRNYRLEKEQET